MAQKRRRGRGEGLIRQRPDGRWEARIDLGWQGGKRVRKTLYGRTWEDVRDKLDDARHAEQQGLLHAGPTPTVGQFLRSWLEVVQPGLRPKTYTSYEGTVRLHLLPDFEKVKLDKLTPIHVHRLLKRKASESLSERSVQYILFVLRIALGKAVRWGLVARNVATMVDGPRVQARNVPALTPEQASVFIEAAREDRLSALYTVALSVGLRQGEALGLRWSSVDLDRRELRVDAALRRVPGKGLVLVEPKTERSQRTIALPRACADALREHRKRQLEDRLLAGSRWMEGDFAFTTLLGYPLDGGVITRNLQRILADAGLPRLRFHDLRHCAASLLGAQGVPPRVVMEVLGHSRMSVTTDVYSHVFRSLLGDAAEAMDRALGGQFGGQAEAESEEQ